MSYRFTKLIFSLFFILILFSGTLSAFAYPIVTEEWCNPGKILLKKYTGKPACVYLTSAEKLIERGWGDYLFSNSFIKISANDTNLTLFDKSTQADSCLNKDQSKVCHFKILADTVCYFSNNTPDICFATSDKPTNYPDCKKLFKFYAQFPLIPPGGDNWYVQNYSSFAYAFCQLPREPHAGDIVYNIANHKVFFAKYGKPSTIEYGIGFENEGGSRDYSGFGSFHSHEKNYEFNYSTKFNLLTHFHILPDTEKDCKITYDDHNSTGTYPLGYDYYAKHFCRL